MTSDGAWLEIVVRARPAALDAVADVLSDFAPDGVSIEPAILPSSVADFEYALLDEPGLVRACVLAPFVAESRRDLEARLAALPFEGAIAPLEVRPLEATDWAEEWKRFYHVLRAGEHMVVKPTWEPFEAAEGDIVVELDPGSAFGTGQHETTRLCLAAIERTVTPGLEVLDLGAGSGILAIAAAKLGARRVVAIDIDAETVPVAAENVRQNGVETTVEVEAGSVGDDWPATIEAPVAGFDVIVANISSTVLVRLMPAIVERLRPGGLLLASGFIEEGVPAVRAAIGNAGLEVQQTDAEGDWRCIVATR
ncbi:MAG: 50S ribosomal protein L11 methyltransferase [Dehalococcoidia bacterium]